MHIFIKMVEETILYQIVADFVNKYERIIEPNLKKGHLDGIKFLMLEQCLRGEDVINNKLPHMKERGAYARYRIAIGTFNSLCQCDKEISKETLEFFSNSLDRYVAELDLILWGNPLYKKLREQKQ